jgi:uncharacterized protein
MRIAIVGAGPAGMFAAYELARKGIEVVIVDMGKAVAQRQRDDGFDLLHGVGGAGTFSDGKINFHTQVGGDLYTFMSAADAWELVDHIEAIFNEYGVEVMDTEDEATHDLEKRAANAGVRFLPIRQAHIGSDLLIEMIDSFSGDLRDLGVTFQLETWVEDVLVEGGRAVGLLARNTRDGDQPIRISADAVILAPGRVGSGWMGEIAQRHDLAIAYNPIDLGVRVEVPAIVMEDVIAISYDPKFYVRTPTYDDRVRTFCVSPHGFVVKEFYPEENAVGVNGHSLKGRQSQNTNFALLTSINLTEPIESTTAYGMSVAQMATTIGGGRPILQSMGDLRRRRRSTWSRLQKSPTDVVPTLRDVTPGDITMALPGRVVTNLLEALEMLARVIPGLDSDRTLLYALELKRYATKPKTDRHLQTEIPGLYVAGDGAGVARGIGGAAATGEITARGILAEAEKAKE